MPTAAPPSVPVSSHPYLERKGVKLHAPAYIEGDKIILPTNTNARQEIHLDGTKISYGKPIGHLKIEGSTQTIVIAEGYATAASIFEATGLTCYVSFGDSGLARVAKEAAEEYPNATIVIAGDNDAHRGGQKAAEKAALAVINGWVATPPETDTDWNDFKGDIVEALNDAMYQPERLAPMPVKIQDNLPFNDGFPDEEIQRMLDKLNPDCDRNTWVRIGMALKSAGQPYSVFEDWSSGSATKFNKRDCGIAWASFKPEGGVTLGTLVHEAKNSGWEPEKQEKQELDTVPVDLVALATKKLEKVKVASMGLDFDPLELEGLVGDTVRWITSTAIFKQPLLAMINTLAFAGAVLGRSYALYPLDTRTNVYMIGLVVTGGGKDHSRKRIQQLAHKAGLMRFIGDHSVRSESGIVRALTTKASQLMMLDEFGMLLRALSDERATHLRNVMKVLTTLYSSSNSVYSHGTYADTKMEPMVLQTPNLCIFGTSTEAAYSPSLKKSAIETGELNRFIVLPNKDDPQPEHNLPPYEISDDFVARWAELGATSNILCMTNSAAMLPVPISVDIGECEQMLRDMIDEQCAHRHDTYAELWNRFRENAIKIGMIFSILDDPKQPVMQKKWLEVGCKIVRFSIKYMEYLAKNNISESQYEQWQHEIVKAIAKKNSISRNELRTVMGKVELRKFNELISDMLEHNIISQAVVGKGQGRKATMYQLSSDD